MKPFKYHKPATIADALRKADGQSVYIAGGTNQVDLMKKQIHQPDALIDLSTAVSDEIISKRKGIEIGAMVTNDRLSTDPLLQKHFPLMGQAVLAGASPQIRNMATTGGNLLQRTRCPYFYNTALPCNKREPGTGCGAMKGDHSGGAIIGYSDHCVAVHPSDLCVALTALDAEVCIIQPNGKEEKIAFGDFHKLPNTYPEKDNILPDQAVIKSIFLPYNKWNKNFNYLKLRERTSYAFALVSVAAALEIKDGKIKKARLASGGVAHKPWRWKEAEDFLIDKEPIREHFKTAAKLCVDQTKPLQQNQYKVMLLMGAVETALVNSITMSNSNQ